MPRITSTLVLAWLCLPGSAGASSSELSSDLAGMKRDVVVTYARVLSAAYDDSLAAAKDLQRACATLTAQPSEPSMAAARAAWRQARVPYLQTEAARFCDGPIDAVEGFINSWPIDEQYIDYVADDSTAGIVNDVKNYAVLTPELIIALNEKEGEKNISTGYHAIEFLLWGQDLSTNGPGNRSWRDYADGSKNSARRGQYLRIVAGLLVARLETLAAAWAEGNPDNYRAEFVAMEPDAALARMLKGLGAFSGAELCGERLTVAYETKEQEEEHSCFSDSTDQDLHYDALGIQNVYLGHYVRTDGTTVQGPGLHNLLLRADAAFAEKLATQIEAGLSAVRAIPRPFDQAILGRNSAPGRVAIKKAISTLQRQAESIARAAAVLSIKLNF